MMMAHPSVVQVLGAYQSGNESFMITELSELGNLKQVLSNQALDSRLKARACLQVAQGIRYLHEQQLLFHRDIKAENVLVFSLDPGASKIQVKLCDFGISKRIPTADGGHRAEASSPPSNLNEEETAVN